MCGYLTMPGNNPADADFLARAASLHGIRGRVSPMRPIPLVKGPTSSVVARWGWPSPWGGILTHARVETAAKLPTWANAWRHGRGVVPIDGWEEGSWQFLAPGAHVAVLWTSQGEDVRLAVITQEPPAAHRHIERFPVPLTQDGAMEWLGGGSLGGQVESMTVSGTHGQMTIF